MSRAVRWRRRLPRSAAAGLFAILVAGGAWWRVTRGAEGGEGQSVEMPTKRDHLPAGGSIAAELAVPVGVDTVARGTLILELTATGEAEAQRRAILSARVAGRIVALPIEEGAVARAGQLLVQLHAGEHALAVERAKAEMEAARARYREMTLFDDRIPDRIVRAERAEAARAMSGLAQAEVSLREAQLAITRTTMSAPFSGRVASVRVTEGQDVAAGDALLTVLDMDPIYVRVQVVEGDLRWLEEEGSAEVMLTAFPDTVLRGRIVAIDPLVDPATRTGRVTVRIANPQALILPGMFARVVLEGRAFRDRVLVPREALIEREGRTLLFLFEPLPKGPAGEGLAKWVYVTPGRSNREMVEIVEGEGTEIPPPGSLVITGDNYTLIHDARVRIDPRGPGEGAS